MDIRIVRETPVYSQYGYTHSVHPIRIVQPRAVMVCAVMTDCSQMEDLNIVMLFREISRRRTMYE